MTEDLYIYCDGGARGNPGPAASAFVVQDSTGREIFRQGLYLGKATNNQAEYRAVLAAVKWLISSGREVKSVTFFLDSLLVANQLKGQYKVKDQALAVIFLQIKNIISSSGLSVVNYIHIPRSRNASADAVVNQTLDSAN